MRKSLVKRSEAMPRRRTRGPCPVAPAGNTSMPATRPLKRSPIVCTGLLETIGVTSSRTLPDRPLSAVISTDVRLVRATLSRAGRAGDCACAAAEAPNAATATTKQRSRIVSTCPTVPQIRSPGRIATFAGRVEASLGIPAPDSPRNAVTNHRPILSLVVKTGRRPFVRSGVVPWIASRLEEGMLFTGPSMHGAVSVLNPDHRIERARLGRAYSNVFNETSIAQAFYCDVLRGRQVREELPDGEAGLSFIVEGTRIDIGRNAAEDGAPI